MVHIDLNSLVPKTITSIGRFTHTLNMSNIFDILPPTDSSEFRMVRLKYDGFMKTRENNWVVERSDTEFKNSITIELEDMECNKIRAIKINCDGIHMCGNRSIKKSERICDTVTALITRVNAFLNRSTGVNSVEEWFTDPLFPTMDTSFRAMLECTCPPSRGAYERILHFCREVVARGGLYGERDGSVVKGPLAIQTLKTVMMNFGYPAPRSIQKIRTKDAFVDALCRAIREEDDAGEFIVKLSYNGHVSPIGWSGFFPMRITHAVTGEVQWFAFQLRQGTIVHSGPNIEAMQKAVDFLFRAIDRI